MVTPLVVEFMVGLIKSGEHDKEDGTMIYDQDLMNDMNLVNIYRTVFDPNNEHEIRYVSIFEREVTSNELFRELYAALWNFRFQGDDPIFSCAPLNNRDTIRKLGETIPLFEKMYNIGEFGMAYSQLLIEKLDSDDRSLKEIQEIGKKVQELDESMVILGSCAKELSPLVADYSVLKENMVGNDTRVLANQTKENYSQLRTNSAIMYNALLKIAKTSQVMLRGKELTVSTAENDQDTEKKIAEG
jgi:hypothetical protein